MMAFALLSPLRLIRVAAANVWVSSMARRTSSKWSGPYLDRTPDRRTDGVQRLLAASLLGYASANTSAVSAAPITKPMKMELYSDQNESVWLLDIVLVP